MDFLDLARKRYSCRKYDSRPVEMEKLEKVLAAGRIAPSAVNYQPWHYYVITGHALEELHSAYHREWFQSAPCVIIICGDHEQSWKRADGKDHCDIDIAITTDHMTLQATELGMATCWVCNFDPERTREFLGLPDHMEPLVLLPLGYPLDHADPDRHLVKRKPLDQVVTYMNAG